MAGKLYDTIDEAFLETAFGEEFWKRVDVLWKIYDQAEAYEREKSIDTEDDRRKGFVPRFMAISIWKNPGLQVPLYGDFYVDPEMYGKEHEPFLEGLVRSYKADFPGDDITWAKEAYSIAEFFGPAESEDEVVSWVEEFSDELDYRHIVGKIESRDCIAVWQVTPATPFKKVREGFSDDDIQYVKIPRALPKGIFAGFAHKVFLPEEESE